jgi:hypothetical protein
MATEHKNGTLKPLPTAKFGTQHYANLYRVPYGTANKWRRRGYNMDDPKVLLKEVMAQKTITADIKTLREMADSLAKPTSTDEQVESAPETEFKPKSSGLLGQLEILEHEANKAYGNYRRARKPLDKQDYFNVWQSILAEMRQVSKVAPQAEAEAGTVLRVEEVEAVWSRAFGEIAATLNAIPRRVATNPKLQAISPVLLEQVVMDEMVRVTKMLGTGEIIRKSTNEDRKR